MQAEFASQPARVTLAAFGSLVALLGLAGLSASSSKLFPAVMLFAGVLFVARALSSSSVSVRDDIVSTVSFGRTRRFALADLDRVEVALGVTGMNSGGREYLVLHEKAGGNFGFKELNAKRPADVEDRSSVVRQAADHINAELTRRRS